MKILIYGNLLPIHEPLRLAEELAMLAPVNALGACRRGRWLSSLVSA